MITIIYRTNTLRGNDSPSQLSNASAKGSYAQNFPALGHFHVGGVCLALSTERNGTEKTNASTTCPIICSAELSIYNMSGWKASIFLQCHIREVKSQ